MSPSALLRSLNSKLVGVAYQQSTAIYLIIHCPVPVQGFAGSASARGWKFRARFHTCLGNPCKFTRRSLHLNERKAPLQILTKTCWNRSNNIYLFGPKLISYIYRINMALKRARFALIEPCQSLQKLKPKQPF